MRFQRYPIDNADIWRLAICSWLLAEYASDVDCISKQLYMVPMGRKIDVYLCENLRDLREKTNFQTFQVVWLLVHKKEPC